MTFSSDTKGTFRRTTEKRKGLKCDFDCTKGWETDLEGEPMEFPVVPAGGLWEFQMGERQGHLAAGHRRYPEHQDWERVETPLANTASGRRTPSSSRQKVTTKPTAGRQSGYPTNSGRGEGATARSLGPVTRSWVQAVGRWSGYLSSAG